MAVNERDPSGGTSFFDLSGELRNAIYEYFIDLKPSAKNAVNLVCTHKQIHSEFGTLFLLRGSLKFEAQELGEFLDYFFVRHPSPTLEDIPCHVEATISCGLRYSFNLLPVISVLRRYSLEITWFERHDGCGVEGYISCSDDINFLKSFLEEMDAQHFENLLAIKFIIQRLERTSELSIIMERGVSIRTVKEWGRDLNYFNVTIRRKGLSAPSFSNLDSDDHF